MFLEVLNPLCCNFSKSPASPLSLLLFTCVLSFQINFSCTTKVNNKKITQLTSRKKGRRGIQGFFSFSVIGWCEESRRATTNTNKPQFTHLHLNTDMNNSGWPQGLINSEAHEPRCYSSEKPGLQRMAGNTDKRAGEQRRCCDAWSKDVSEASLSPLKTDLFRANSHWQSQSLPMF